MQHVAHERALAAAAHAGDADEPFERQRDGQVAQVVARCAADREPVRAGTLADGAARLQRMPRGRCEHSARYRFARGEQILEAAVDDDLPAVAAGARAEIHDVLRAPDRRFVVLDDDDRVALLRELRNRAEQQIVVPRMQTDRRLIEDVADAAQIGAELCSEPDALRFAARERRRAAIEREIRKADEVEEAQAADELRQHVARNLALAVLELQAAKVRERLPYRLRRELADAAIAKPHRHGLRPQPLPFALRANLRVFLGFFPPRLLARLLGVEALKLDARAVAARTPTIAGVVGKEPRIQRLETASAASARALGGKKLARACDAAVALGDRQHANHVASHAQSLVERVRKLRDRPRPRPRCPRSAARCRAP